MGVYITTSTAISVLMYGVDFDTATTLLLNKTIEHAENEVNKFLGKRYDISTIAATSTSVPPLARSLAEQLCEGYTWQRLARGNKEWRDRGAELIKGAKENLKQIADYDLNLLNTAGSAIVDMSGSGFSVLCNTDGYSTTFDEDDELSWRIDINKLSDISDGRN